MHELKDCCVVITSCIVYLMQVFFAPLSDHCLLRPTLVCLECVMVCVVEMLTVPSPIIKKSWKIGIKNVQLKEGVSLHVYIRPACM